MEQWVEIYALKHPITGEIRYVGKANDSKIRLKGHIRNSRRSNAPVHKWIKSLSDNGLQPVASVLVKCENDKWPEWEKAVIKRFKAKGVRLLNVAEGGDEPYCTLDDRRERIKEMNEVKDNWPQWRKDLEKIKFRAGKYVEFLKKSGMTDKIPEQYQKMGKFAKIRPDLFPGWVKHIPAYEAANGSA